MRYLMQDLYETGKTNKEGFTAEFDPTLFYVGSYLT